MRISILLLILMVSLRVYSQDPVEQKMYNGLTSLIQRFHTTRLYVHLDKSIYVHNENIWFTGYILQTPVSLKEHHTLYAFLTSKTDHTIVASEKFVMDGGIGFGYMFIPDSIPSGDYDFVAFTNQTPLEWDRPLFQQEIKIRSLQSKSYTIQWAESKKISEDSSLMIAKIFNKEAMYAKGTKVNYTVMADGETVSRGDAVVDAFGELPIGLSHTKAQGKKLELITEINDNGKPYKTRMDLPLYKNDINIHWYPEGGDLVNGIASTVAFETRSTNDKPISLKAVLTENGKPLSTVETNASGVGLFAIIPTAGMKYSLQPVSDSFHVVAEICPPVMESGYTLSVPKAVLGDTLKMELACSRQNVKAFVLIHNYEQDSYFADIKLFSGRRVIKIPSTELPMGMSTVVLLDSVGNPVAERSIFRGYGQFNVKISFDSAVYHKRSKVDVKINTTDETGKPVPASLSMATVFSRRMDTTSFQDIVPYFFFGNFFNRTGNKKPSLYNFGKREDMELMLRTRGWTRYVWNEKEETGVAQNRPLEEGGRILYHEKKLGKPVELVLMSSAGMNTVITDENGHFELTPEQLTLAPDEQLMLMVNANGRQGYSVVFNHQTDSFEKELATIDFPSLSTVKAEIGDEEKIFTQKVFLMKEVVIKTKARNENYINGVKVFRSENCNDYVCMYNILNCTNHPFGSKPVDGTTYLQRTPMGTENVVYKGCVDAMTKLNAGQVFFKLKGRYYTKEFYVADYQKFNPADPETLSTIYWNPQIVTDEKGEAHISFYTNDLAGIFYTILEGVTNSGPVSGKSSFKVE